MVDYLANHYYSLLVILLVAVLTFLTRLLPFWIFKNNQRPLPVLADLNKLLPPAVIAILLVFCLENISWQEQKGSLYQLLAVALVAILHVWKKNNLLSIGLGTLAYMLLVQFF